MRSALAIFGAYEIPEFGLGEIALHKPTGTRVEIIGYMVLFIPIILYAVKDTEGVVQFDEWVSLSDLKAIRHDN